MAQVNIEKIKANGHSTAKKKFGNMAGGRSDIEWEAIPLERLKTRIKNKQATDVYVLANTQ